MLVYDAAEAAVGCLVYLTCVLRVCRGPDELVRYAGNH